MLGMSTQQQQRAEDTNPPELARLSRGLLGERLLFLWSLRLERRPDHWMDKPSGFRGPCLDSGEGEINIQVTFVQIDWITIESFGI